MWSAQALYARAFYAAGDTLTPMVASTLIVVASLPMYSAMFRHFDIAGLAMASDLGILLHTVVMAWLLGRKKLVALERTSVGGVDEGAGDSDLCRCAVLRGGAPGGCARQLANAIWCRWR